MNNEYLYIKDNEINYQDNAFSGIAPLSKDEVEGFCLNKAEEWRNSQLANYDDFDAGQREEIAQRWEKVKDLPDGFYEYYFNFEDKYEMFETYVKELAERLKITYKLEVF